jgi:hypothetical protein
MRPKYLVPALLSFSMLGALVGLSEPSAALREVPLRTPATTTREAAAAARPATTAAPVTCHELVGEVEAAFTRAPAGEAANALHERIVVASRETSCREALDAAALRAPCGAGVGLVTSALFAAEGYPAAATRKHVARAKEMLSQGDGSCLVAVLPSVQFASDVDLPLADDVAALAAMKDDNARAAGWLTLGSLSFRAKTAGNAKLAGTLNARLLAGMRKFPHDAMVVDAAGNAGCESCTPAFDAARRDPNPWVRRTAASAYRFVTNAPAVSAMCASLRDDGHAAVREHAAWSLAFGGNALPERSACLVEAVRSDADVDVRRSAARALVNLASVSADASRALLDLHGPELPRDVRIIVLEHLSAGDAPVVHEDPLKG